MTDTRAAKHRGSHVLPRLQNQKLPIMNFCFYQIKTLLQRKLSPLPPDLWVSSTLPSADRLNMPLFREPGDDECVSLHDGGMVGQRYEGGIDDEGLLVWPWPHGFPWSWDCPKGRRRSRTQRCSAVIKPLRLHPFPLSSFITTARGVTRGTYSTPPPLSTPSAFL